MALAVVQSVVSLAAASGTPADVTQNVFHFRWDTLDPESELSVIHTALVAFYNNTYAPVVNSISDWIGDTVSRATDSSIIRSYINTDLTGGTPFGSPDLTTMFTLGAAAAGAGLPQECAVCCSFHGTLTDIPETAPNPSPPPATIRPAARRRGRVFIGPLDQTAAVTSGTNVFVVTSVIESVNAAAQNLEDDLDAEHNWVVWSRPDASLYNVVGGFVDNAFDTQRRRGPVASTRTVWP